MDNTEITVDSKSVEDSLAHITEIATRFQICAQQRLMIMDSKGKTAEELAKMYDNILLVVKKCRNLWSRQVCLLIVQIDHLQKRIM